jgi:REP element-mobilizing transposase RayT
MEPGRKDRGRRSIRLKGYDYSQPGAYFVTLVAQGRTGLFGHIEAGDMCLNEAGQMIASIWVSLATRFPNIEIDTFQVMPNHLHGIIIVVEKTVEKTVGAGLVPAPSGATTRVAPTLGEIVGAYKSMTTLEYIRGVDERGWTQFDRRLWQRNYWERVIRDEREWDRIRRYIQANPLNWAEDEEFLPS